MDTIVEVFTPNKITSCPTTPPQLSNRYTLVFKAILLGLFLVFPFSCQPPSDPLLPQEVVDPSISIEEAKAWFERNYGAPAAANARTTKTSKKTPIWEIAKEGKFKQGHPLVVVPLSYEQDHPINSIFDGTDKPSTPDTWEYDHTLIRKLIIFKNKKAENKALVMYVVPSQQYKLANPRKIDGANFTGMLLFKDYDEENLLEAWRMENGQVVDVLGGSSTGQPKKNGRTNSTCYVISYGYMDCGETNGGSSDDNCIGEDCPGKLGDGSINNQRVSAITGCSFTQTGGDVTCSSEGSGYFEGQLPPSGGGGAGIDDAALGNDPYNYEYRNAFRLKWGNTFSALEYDYLENMPHFMQSIEDIIARAGSVIRAMDPSWLLNQIQWAMNQGVNNEEIKVLQRIGGIYRINLMVYASNALIAKEATNFNFENNRTNGLTADDCGTCIGNAFKHALFRALDCVQFDTYYAKELGIAHESEEDPNNFRETSMDLFNNNKGIDAFNAIPFQLKNSIINALPELRKMINLMIQNGQLQYIKAKPGDDKNTWQTVPTDVSGLSPQ